MRVSALLPLVVVGSSLVFVSTALAGQPTGLDAPDQTPLIANGSPVPTCGWPTAVAVEGGGGLCTGTLVHPQVVVYAAHCGAGNKTIRFGETAFGGGRSVGTALCETYPEYAGVEDQAHDWAYCRLDEPVTDIPVTPILHGACESTILQVNQEVAVTGFGDTLQGSAGSKNWGMTFLAAVNKPGNITVVGTSGTASVCPGDSGGPALVRFPDGSWHAFGIASTVSGGCGGVGTHSLITGAVPWLEEQTQIDLTPCHTRDGEWAPGPECGGFNSLEAGQGGGSWNDWCAGVVPVSGKSNVCGPAWDEFDAALPPAVAITSPTWGTMYDPGATVDILVDALKDPAGPAIKEIRLRINGAEVATDGLDPYAFIGAQFVNEGVYELVAVGEDWMGNIVESEPVAIGVGNVTVPPMPEPDPTGGGEGESDGDGGTDGGGSADSASGGDEVGLDDGGSAGSGCSTTTLDQRSGLAGLLLAGLALVRRRRR